jgi:integrase
MTLSAMTVRYLATRDVSAVYAKRLAKRAAAIESRTRRTRLADVLNEDCVNGFLRSLDLAPHTVRCYRADLLTLWNFAGDMGLAEYPIARRIYRVKVPPPVIECYEIAEARALRDAAAKLVGCYPNGVSRSCYWAAAITLAWDSGIRRSDVWLFRRDHVRPDGTIRLVQHKTQKLHVAKLRASTIAALDAIGLQKPCEWMLHPSFFGRHFRKLAKLAGIYRGSFKFLRRSSGSFVELAQAGAGRRHLGQSSQRVFDTYYDAKLTNPNIPQPPEL